ncbi:hypothetical protein NHF40_02880 [Maricaulaceae bacterium EIL42A08]|nr:hypothetical protein [Maricaulaceae bacterium EIL42A08]
MTHVLKIVFVALVAWIVSFCFAAPVVLAAGWPMMFAHGLAGAAAGAAAVRMHSRRLTERAQLSAT